MHIDHAPEVYKVDTPILKTLLSSFVPNNTSVLFGLKHLVLSCNREDKGSIRLANF